MLDHTISRRAILAAGAAGAVGAMAGCRTNNNNPGTQPTTGGGPVPAYVPFAAAQPDQAGDGALGIPNYYAKYPDPAPVFWKEPAAKVETITYLAQTPPELVPNPGNKWFEQVTELLGTELKVIPGSYTGYESKLQVMIAGNDLPDVLMMPTMPKMPDLLAAEFTDLTPYLSGDNIKQFPGLASTPTSAWSTSTLNGKIWGTVNSRVPSSTVLSVRGDKMQAKGIDPSKPLANGQEFISMMSELGDPANKAYAFGEDPLDYMMPLVLQMVGAPNNWAESGGKFTHMYETEQYKKALDIVTQLWKAGVFHPQSIVDNTQIRAWFDSEITYSYAWTLTGWSGLAALQPTWNVIPLELPKWDGGGATNIFEGDSAYYAFNAIPKQESEARLMEILHVLDRVSSPWGTDEFLKLLYGVRDLHYTLVDGKITVTDAGKADVKGWLPYAGGQGGQALYNPLNADLALRQFEIMKATRPTVVKNAAKGLYSDTWQSKAATMASKIRDTQLQIIQGNSPMSGWDTMVAEFKSGVADTAREEYAAAFALGK